jgi:hypothetical protein
MLAGPRLPYQPQLAAGTIPYSPCTYCPKASSSPRAKAVSRAGYLSMGDFSHTCLHESQSHLEPGNSGCTNCKLHYSGCHTTVRRQAAKQRKGRPLTTWTKREGSVSQIPARAQTCRTYAAQQHAVPLTLTLRMKCPASFGPGACAGHDILRDGHLL